MERGVENGWALQQRVCLRHSAFCFLQCSKRMMGLLYREIQIQREKTKKKQ